MILFLCLFQLPPLPSPPLPSPQVSYQAYGDTVTVDLKPGGKDIRVTKGNREGEVMGNPPFLQALSPAQVPFPLCSSRVC